AARVLLNYAIVLDSFGESDKALQYAERAVRMWRSMNGPRDRRWAMGLDIAAVVNLNAGNIETALQQYDEVLDIVATLDKAPADWDISLYNMARAWARHGDTDRALAKLREALDHGLSDPSFVEHPDLQPLHGLPGFEAMAGELTSRAGSD
ncbi:MAG TPA: tetratricopeptide repeat protein, partial [Candidatus Sulfomarinibacteraceae bacterium]|nr:tetratricopeptide repeat protein [Candidatus Sulfomarinibacteraceae bacterium]